MADKIDVKSMSLETLNQEIESAEKHLAQLQFNNSISTLDDTSVIQKTRRDIARMKTELGARKLKEAEEAGTLKRDKIRARRRLQK